MQGYAGSIAASRKGDLIGLTSAKAGAVLLFVTAGTPTATHHRADISGIANGAAGLIATDGQGAVWRVETAGLSLLSQTDVAWDNHLISLDFAG
jgi:hypothetical protein